MSPIIFWLLIGCGWAFMGHCFYMFAEFVAEENGNEDRSFWGWTLCLFFWPLVILIVGITRSFYKMLS